MLVEDTFEVGLPVEDAWRLLTDIEQVVPCVPGASLDEIVDGEYRGRVTARIGPITVKYAGVARFVERDEVDHRAVISLRGQEERGNGSVTATVTTLLKPDHDRTRVDMATELDVSGRAAQFGRGILGDVASSVLGEFAAQLEQMVEGTGNGRTEAAAAASPTRPAAPAPAALDVRRVVLVPILKRASFPVACVLVGGFGGWLLGRAGRPPARRRLPRIVIQTR
jgi:carbon monoxide dehydrogenase subunit G